jgi:hypothetical protein
MAVVTALVLEMLERAALVAAEKQVELAALETRHQHLHLKVIAVVVGLGLPTSLVAAVGVHLPQERQVEQMVVMVAMERHHQFRALL